MTILDAMRDRALFGPWFDPSSWRAWFVFLAALFGLPIVDDDVELYREHTGRTTTPTSPAREAWVIVGRRGGKSRIAAAIAVYLACFVDHRPKLAPGEVGTVALIAADRRQARTLMRYIGGFFDAVPMLGRMVTGRTKESITLNNRVVIEVQTANFRAVRGYTLVAVIADEVAFWNSDEAGANPDAEIINGLRPGLTTTGGLLLGISSPYARRGVLWDAYRKHHGADDDPVLVWQARTDAMNPRVDRQVIADAYADDAASAAAEYGAEFRRDVESFVSREVVEQCVVPGRFELPPMLRGRHVACADVSSGTGPDSTAVAIAHHDHERDVDVLDALLELRPPFLPDEAVRQTVKLLARYHVRTVYLDRWGGEWVRGRLREFGGIECVTLPLVKSDVYLETLPTLAGGAAELLDHPRMIAQLLQLERRTARSGRDVVDHGRSRNCHDDLINAACGALYAAKLRERAALRVVNGGI